MNQDQTNTVAFSGHRTYDGAANDMLRAAVAELYDRGFRTFLCGMAVGFDMQAAQAVLVCRSSRPDLRLVCVVPFAGQENRFSAADRDSYAQIVAAADQTLVLAPTYSLDSYTRRNNYLVDHAAVLVAWFDGSPGGTAYTIRRAQRRGLEVQNLCSAAPAGTNSDPRLF